MALKVFVYSILFLSGFLVLGNVDTNVEKENKTEAALLNFKDATMYTLTQDNITRIINAKEVYRFKNKDLMYNATIILNNELSVGSDTIKADIMEKRAQKYTFINNASFQRDNYLFLKSNEFFYNGETQILTNTIDYTGYYYNNTLAGDSIYYNNLKNIFKSKNVHFEVEIQNN